jgi:K+-sensing histidine kinase KdpD
VALDNARLFVESQSALEAERRAYGELSRQAWGELLQTRPVQGYRYINKQITPIDEPHQESAGGRAVSAAVTAEGPMLAVPIRVRDQVIGKIDLHKGAEDAEWTPTEIAMAEKLAEQLNVALESARLYEDTQRRAAQEKLTGEAAARMRESLDMETVLQTAVKQFGEIFALPKVEIYLSAEESGNGQSDKQSLDTPIEQ